MNQVAEENGMVRSTDRMPDDFRALTISEAERIKLDDRVTVLERATGCVYRGRVISTYKGAHLNVEFGNKHVETFLAETDGMDAEYGKVLTPENEYMLIVQPEATPDDLIIPALANSAPFMRLATRVIRCESAISEVNRRAQPQISRDEFDELKALVGVLHNDLIAIRRHLNVKLSA